MAYTPNNPNGQKTMANSGPVVIASDQSSIPVAATQTTTPWVTSNATTSVVGNGTSATAQRVTLANDSTGVIATVGAVTAITNALPVGANVIGKVSIDQTTPGTTNKVDIADSLNNPVSAFPATFLRVTDEPHQLFYDPFDSTLDVTNRWTSTQGSSGVAASNTAGVMSMGTGTVANGYSKLTSQASFVPTIPAWLGVSDAIALPDGAAPTANSYRYWGTGTTPGTPTVATPITDGYGFELNTDGKLRAVVYAGGTRTVIQDLSTSGNSTQPLDANYHRYIIYIRTDKAYWYIDGITSAQLVATSNFQSSQVQTLPRLFLAVGNSTPPGGNTQIQCTGATAWDTGKNNIQISDGTFPWRKATISSTGALSTTIAANSSVNVAQVAGTTTSVNNGTTDAGTTRVTLSSDSTGQVKLATGANTIGALTANQSINTAQINAVTVLTGTGATGTGSQRVTVATDSATVAGSASIPAGTNLMGKVGIDQTTVGTTNGVSLAQLGTGTINAGNGTSGTGTLRVAIASDNTANTNPFLVTQTPATAGGLTIASGTIGNTATSIKGTAGQVYGWYIYNSNASVSYVQFYNVASGSVTPGTTGPTFSIGIPATSGANVHFNSGIAFGTAITIAITTTRSGGTSPGSTVDYNVFYK